MLLEMRRALGEKHRQRTRVRDDWDEHRRGGDCGIVAAGAVVTVY
jgi:hypothetical protein